MGKETQVNYTAMYYFYRVYIMSRDEACRRAFATILTVTLTACASPSLPTNPAHAMLIDTLRAGGHVIYMRHTIADVDRDVQQGDAWWKRCGDGHRMLAEQGRADARSVGAAIRRLGIPIAEVRASEYCRAAETASLLAVGAPRPDERLNGWPMWKSVDAGNGFERLASGTRTLLATRPARGNVLLVSHKQDFDKPSDPVLADLKDGESAVFTPDGRGGFVLRGRLTVVDWTDAIQPL